MVQTCLDKVASPTLKVPLSFKRITSAPDVIGQSPFRTPPSLSYRPDKVIDFLCIKIGAYMFLCLDRVMVLDFVFYKVGVSVFLFIDCLLLSEFCFEQKDA